ncbi:hypothetical protein TNCV_2542351 [Trichonephila clavipes]|nr:hypothetical protein TNCV_2542351 [Trichonephila clavipes]
MCTVAIHHREGKLLSGIDVSEKAGKVSKTMDTLDVRRLPTPQKTSKKFLRRYINSFLGVNRNENLKLATSETEAHLLAFLQSNDIQLASSENIGFRQSTMFSIDILTVYQLMMLNWLLSSKDICFLAFSSCFAADEWQ